MPLPQSKLVFAIRFHEYLDVILLPYMVQENCSGEFLYSSKLLNSLTLADHFPDCTEDEKRVVRLLDECRDEELLKKFSKKTKTISDFFNDETEERLKTIVIPYVQKRIDKSLRILMNAKIPLNFKGRKNDPVLPAPIIIRSEVAKAVFNFVRHENESHYFLTLGHSGNDIPLNRPGTLLLVNSPGWVLAGGSVYLLEPGIDGNKLRPFFTRNHIVIPHATEEKYFSTFVKKALKNYEVRIKGIGINIERPLCRPVLKLESDQDGSPVISLSFLYGNKKCMWSDKNSCWVEFYANGNDYTFERVMRNKEKERTFIDSLIEGGLVSSDLSLFRLPASALFYSLVEWLSRKSGELDILGFIVKQSPSPSISN